MSQAPLSTLSSIGCYCWVPGRSLASDVRGIQPWVLLPSFISHCHGLYFRGLTGGFQGRVELVGKATSGLTYANFITKLRYKVDWGHEVPTFMEPSFNTSDHVSPQIDAASRAPYMLLQSLANLHFCTCPSGRYVNPPANFTVELRSRYILRCNLKRTVCVVSIVVSCHHCGHKHLQPFRRRHG